MEENLKRALEAAGLTVSEYAEFTDELLTDDEIALMRKHNIPKPEAVTWSRWEQPTVLTARHKKIIHLAAMGKTQAVIAEEVGMSTRGVSHLLCSPLFKQKVAKKQELLFEHDIKGQLKTLINQSYGAIQSILEDHNEKSSVKLEAAKYIIDHVVGKATQHHEVNGSLLADFITRLDQERVVKQIQSTPEEPEYVATEVPIEVADEASATALKVLETERDDMDHLVDSIIQGKELVVGKRSSDGTGT